MFRLKHIPTLSLSTLLVLATVFHAAGQITLQRAADFSTKLRAEKIAGVEDSVFCGSYAVFENRESKTGRKINLNIIVIPSLHPDSATTPIFYLEGGPGVAATSNASFFANATIPYRHNHDIVLVDIRGTGRSNPLNCPSLQIKRGLREQLGDMYVPELVKECYDSLSQIADLTQYTTTNVIYDLEEVRKWLGYEKINLYGLSYGTRLALVYMKLFPLAIASSILWSPVPSYGRMPLYHAQFAQKSLEKIFEDCRKDPLCHLSFPDIAREFNSLMYKMRKRPVVFAQVNEAAEFQKIRITWNSFQTKLRTLMYAPAGIRRIPFIIHQAYRGNFEPFISLFPGGPDTSYFLAEGFYLCVTCAEDVPFIKAGEIKALTDHSFMGSYRVDQQKGACAQWIQGPVPADFLTPTLSDIPTLILSGGFDPVTPTSLAREIASHLSRCTLVIIPEMSHVPDGLSNLDCFDEICLRFINNPSDPKLKCDCISSMRPEKYQVR